MTKAELWRTLVMLAIIWLLAVFAVGWGDATGALVGVLAAMWWRIRKKGGLHD